VMARYENHERGVAEPLWSLEPDVDPVEDHGTVAVATARAARDCGRACLPARSS
jgi:hypothetical protein